MMGYGYGLGFGVGGLLWGVGCLLLIVGLVVAHRLGSWADGAGKGSRGRIGLQRARPTRHPADAIRPRRDQRDRVRADEEDYGIIGSEPPPRPRRGSRSP